MSHFTTGLPNDVIFSIVYYDHFRVDQGDGGKFQKKNLVKCGKADINQAHQSFFYVCYPFK